MVTFNGISTCSHTSYGNYNFRSNLSFEAETRSMSNRSDVNAHLSKLSNDNAMSEFIEKEKRCYADFLQTINCTQCSYGAAFVSLEASVILKREISDEKFEAIVNHLDREDPTIVF